MLESLPSSKTTCWIPTTLPVVSDNKSVSSTRDVYLGGICGSNETWRTDLAIPLFK